jgi:hypothetical protein
VCKHAHSYNFRAFHDHAAAQCVKEKASQEDQASEPPAPVVRTAFPARAAGFEFGTSAQDAAAACTGAGGQWAEGEPESTCSKPAVSVGIDGRALITLCDGRVCKVRIAQEKPDQQATELRQSFAKVAAALRQKYGSPDQLSVLVPPTCEAKLVGCLRAKQARISAVWGWPDKQAISATVGAAGENVVLVIEYRSSGQAREGAPGL